MRPPDPGFHSHSLGGSVLPHDLKRTGEDAWLYRNGRNGEAEVRQRILTGGAGFVAMWRACTLHGAQPDAADHERISLRYLFAKRHPGRAGLDEVNARLKGPLSLADTRTDLAADGSAAIRPPSTRPDQPRGAGEARKPRLHGRPPGAREM